jgi:hypothetical protein
VLSKLGNWTRDIRLHEPLGERGRLNQAVRQQRANELEVLLGPGDQLRYRRIMRLEAQTRGSTGRG